MKKQNFEMELDISLFEDLDQPAMIFDKEKNVVQSNQIAQVFLNAKASNVRQILDEFIKKSFVENKIINQRVQIAFSAVELTYDLKIIPINQGKNVVVIATDNTLDTNMKKVLMESRQRYKDFVETASDFAWETNLQGEFIFVSPSGAMGYSAKELIGKNASDFILNKEQVINPFMAKHKVEALQVWLKNKNLESACYSIFTKPVITKEGEQQAIRGVCKDITDIKKLDATIEQARNRDELLSKIIKDFRDEVKPENLLPKATQTICKALKINSCNISRINASGGIIDNISYGNPFDKIVEIKEFFNEEVLSSQTDNNLIISAITSYNRKKNGIISFYKSNLEKWNDNERSIITDIAVQIGIVIAQLNQHEHILSLSRTDTLTQLFNRRAFFEEATRRYKRLYKDNKHASLFYLDLDNFKMVNDVHGHHKGDEVLIKLKEILLKSTRPNDIVARLGGDEFAIWFDDIDQNAMKKRAKEILTMCNEKLFPLSASEQYPLGLSIGIAISKDENNISLQDFIKQADKAMYEAKKSGKGTYKIL